MRNRPQRMLFVAGLMVGFILSSCGGGGDSATVAGPPLPPKILSWSSPTAYTDNTPLDPVLELDSFEIYVNTSGSFSYSDAPFASVRAVVPGSNQVTSEFDLAKLDPFLSRGVPYYVSLRAVAISGARSEFSPSAPFSF